MKRSFAALAAFLAVACTPMEWTRSGASPEDLRADMQQCQQQAWQEANSQMFHYYGAYGPFPYADPFGQRFMAWPDSFIHDLHGERFIEESRLANFCMRAKGWEVAPAAK